MLIATIAIALAFTFIMPTFTQNYGGVYVAGTDTSTANTAMSSNSAPKDVGTGVPMGKDAASAGATMGTRESIPIPQEALKSQT